MIWLKRPELIWMSDAISLEPQHDSQYKQHNILWKLTNCEQAKMTLLCATRVAKTAVTQR